jgi:ferredoxin-like protein FixX
MFACKAFTSCHQLNTLVFLLPIGIWFYGVINHFKIAKLKCPACDILYKKSYMNSSINNSKNVRDYIRYGRCMNCGECDINVPGR